MVRAGSKYDPSTATGLAHYLEHMLFKGTNEIATLDWATESAYLDQISDLYEKRRNTTDEAERAMIYALSGFCSALAGVVYCLYTQSGNPNAGTGLELDAIAAVVIGGTLLSGGVGYVAGTVVGVLIFGIIQTAIVYQGTLSR